MSQIPGNTNKNDASFMTTAGMANRVAGSVPSAARNRLRDSFNESRDIVDNGEEAEYPRIMDAPRSIPNSDSHNPRPY